MDIANLILDHLKKLSNPMNKEPKKKEFDTVKFFREVKEKISKETEGMSFEQFKEYLSAHKVRPVVR